MNITCINIFIEYLDSKDQANKIVNRCLFKL